MSITVDSTILIRGPKEEIERFLAERRGPNTLEPFPRRRGGEIGRRPKYTVTATMGIDHPVGTVIGYRTMNIWKHFGSSLRPFSRHYPSLLFEESIHSAEAYYSGLVLTLNGNELFSYFKDESDILDTWKKVGHREKAETRTRAKQHSGGNGANSSDEAPPWETA